MNSILLLFFSLSLSGSLLAVILLGIKPLIKKRLSQTWQYYIWLIVILRFLLPFTSQMSVVGEMTSYFQGAIATPTVGEMNLEINENRDIITSTSPQVPNTSQEVLNPQEIKTEAEEHTTYWNEILNNIWVLWLGVALVLFAQKVTSYRSFVRFVKIGTKEITDARILDIYVTEITKAKVKRPLPLYVNDQVVSPMLIGILQPSIVMPTLKINDDELRHIFQHELTHHRRLDFLYKWIVQIAMCLHWFNPLVYLINKEINRLCELSCDETVIKHLDVDSRVTYGDALIATLKSPGSYNSFVLSITMSENADLVKERLDMMMSYKKKSGLIICISALLTFILICGFTFTGAYAADNRDKIAEVDNSNIIPKENETVVVPDNYKQIVKTLAGTNIQNINIDAAYCVLQFEQTTGNTFEVIFSYPEIISYDYANNFDLRMDKVGSNTINISTDYNNHDFINDSEGIDDNYLASAILTIKIPQKQYNNIRLNLFAINSRTIDFSFNASTLELVSNSADVSLKTDKVFERFSINHNAGNFDLQLQQLSKNMNFDIAISDFTMSLPSDPQNLSLTVNNKDNSACELPTVWGQAISGDRIVYESGNKQRIINVNNGKHAMFRINIAGEVNQQRDTLSSIPENDLPASGNSDSFNETHQVYANIDSTQYSKKKHFEAINGANYFSYGRIDVEDNNGYAYQAIVFICIGSDSYVKTFYRALEQLSSAYPNSQNRITGYLDLIRDNRLRNYGTDDFSAIEKVTVTNANGIQYEAYVVAICGSDIFMKSYHDFYENVMDVYYNK